MKKFAGILCVLVLCLSLCAPALAEPLTAETVTFNVFTRLDPFLKVDPNEIPMWSVLEEGTNVKMNVTGAVKADYQEKVSLMIAGGELPDAFLCSPKTITEEYYNTGLFLPLEELVKEYAPSYAAILADPAVYANCTAPDGHIYALPYGEEAEWRINHEMFMNTEWLDKLNLEMPTTLDEFYTVLKAFKEQDPNGNGLADEIPFCITIAAENQYWTRLFGLFGLTLDANLEMVTAEGEFVYGPARNEFRTALEWLHKLYAEGLLDQECITQTRSEMQAKGSGEYNVIGSTIWFWLDDFCTATETVKYDSVPVLTGGCENPGWICNNTMPGPEGIAITTNCKTPELLMKWAEYVNQSPAMIQELRYGPMAEGAVAYWDENNQCYLNNEGTPEGMTWEEWSQSNCIRDMVGYCMTAEQSSVINAIDPNTARKNGYNDKYMDYLRSTYVTVAHKAFYADDFEKEEADTIQMDMNDITDSFVADAVMNGITDEQWNAFQQNLQRAGVERYTAIWQASVDKSLGK